MLCLCAAWARHKNTRLGLGIHHGLAENLCIARLKQLEMSPQTQTAIIYLAALWLVTTSAQIPPPPDVKVC